MRTRTLLGGIAAALCALSGCALIGGGAAAKTAATSAVTHTPSAPPSSYAPLAGPSEAASALPKACSRMLGAAQLQAVFGAGLPIGDNYGVYAGLASIGRTGRVACVFGVGLDSFGKQSAGAIEVSISTYNSASNAVGRAADTVQTDSEAGATTAEVSVGGHPATIVVEQTAVGASTTPAGLSVSAAPTTPTAATTPGSPATASTVAASPAVSNGETQLVMADGNRTFVLQIPFTKLSAQQAATALTKLALEVYQNTLPGAAG